MRRDFIDNPDAPKINAVVPSVTAVVTDEDQILLVHKVDNDLWALPGGGHDMGEFIADTVRRETLEETGYHVEVDRLTGVYTNPRHVIAYDDGEVRQQFSLCFKCTVLSGEARTSSETKAVKWVQLDRLGDLNMHPSMRLRIRHGIEGRSAPFIG